MKKIALAILLIVYSCSIFGSVAITYENNSRYGSNEVLKQHAHIQKGAVHSNGYHFTILPAKTESSLYLVSFCQVSYHFKTSKTNRYNHSIPLYLLHAVYRI